MTVRRELADLFRHDNGTSPIVVSVKGVDARFEETGMVALAATILDPLSFEPTEMTLLVQMLPVDAYGFARAVDEAAKREAWKFPADAKFVAWKGQEKKDFK